MTDSHPRGPRRPRRRPVLRHHLEDEFDAELDRIHGSGRSRKRSHQRRARQYEHLAGALVEGFVEREFEDPAFEEARVVDLQLQANGGLLLVFVRVPLDHDIEEASLRRLEQELRDELCHHLPRRRTPEVRVSLVPEGGEPLHGDDSLHGGEL